MKCSWKLVLNINHYSINFRFSPVLTQYGLGKDETENYFFHLLHLSWVTDQSC